jgi:transcriptional regulator with XRE-family HTH domain
MAKAKLGRARAGRFDIEVGKRIRLRRIERKMSQTELAKKVSVTFQQIQKYEKGINRPGTDRLIQISRALDVPLSFFIEADDHRRKVEGLLVVDPSWGIRLMRAYARIEDRKIRRQIVLLVESVADQAE